MANPQFATNAYLRFGAPISAVVRVTTQLAVNRSSNAKAIPTTTGEVGFTSGVRMSELSFTALCTRGSTQQRGLVAAFEAQTPMPYVYNDGNMDHPGTGVISGLNITSQTNEAIEYSFTLAGADGTST
jgi:hypothetical protein